MKSTKSHLDRETMESLGYFFLEIGMVPRSWASRRQKAQSLEADQYRGPDVIWWRDHEPAVEVRVLGDSTWTRTDPTGWYLSDDVEQISWSVRENHRVEITLTNQGKLTEFTVLIDIRTAYSDFVDQVIMMAEKTGCLFFDFEDQQVVEPTRDWVLSKIKHHEMNHVIFDSSGRLAPH